MGDIWRVWIDTGGTFTDAVARAPASVTPPFQTTTGFIAAARWSERTKRGPSFTPSMYMAMIFVSASSAR